MSQFEYIDTLLALDDGQTWRSMVEILKQINSPVANVRLRPLYRAAQRRVSSRVLPPNESV